MNFLILFVIFLTLCEEMVNLQTLTKKTPLSIYEYSFDLQPPATKTIFFLYALLLHTTMQGFVIGEEFVLDILTFVFHKCTAKRQGGYLYSQPTKLQNK